MLFVYFSTLLESILKSGLLESALLAGKNWVGIVGVGIVGVGIIAPTQKFHETAKILCFNEYRGCLMKKMKQNWTNKILGFVGQINCFYCI
jgi:hypothetical protein